MFSVDKCLGFIDEVGDKATRVIVKTDQEPALKALRDAIINKLDKNLVAEESPVEESQSNGEIENAIILIEIAIIPIERAIVLIQKVLLNLLPQQYSKAPTK